MTAAQYNASFRSIMDATACPPQAFILSLVIPCFNEAASIPLMAAEIADLLKEIQLSPLISDVEVIVVDDASTDSSLDLARSYSQWKVLTHSQNQGYGAALKTGLRSARGNLLAFIDMDVTYCPMDIPAMVDALHKGAHDVVFGCRPRGPEAGMPRIRQLGNAFFVQLAGWLFGPRLNDVCTGLRVMRADHVNALLDATPENDLSFSLALTANLLASNRSIAEVPVRYRERTGKSKLNVVRDGLRFLRALSERRHAQNFYRPVTHR